MNRKEIQLEEIMRENERRFHYHLYRIGIHDPYKDLFKTSIHVHWKAYNQYNPNNGTLATYFNYLICQHLSEIHKDE